jgi:hypothetical protein
MWKVMARTNEGAWYLSKSCQKREEAIAWARIILASEWINHVSVIEETDGTGEKPVPPAKG